MPFIEDINKNKKEEKNNQGGFLKDLGDTFSGNNANYLPEIKSVNEDVSGYGESKYDNPSSTRFENSSDINEIRANRQSVLDKYGNGLVKMAGTAATSAIEPFVDISYGILKGITDGKFSSVYDNEITQKLDEFNNYLQKELPHYYSKQELDNGIIENLGKANFWSDKVLNGLGFALGAVASSYASMGLTNVLRGKSFFQALPKLATGEAILGTGDEISKALSLARTQKIKDGGQLLFTNLMGAIGESGMEARETKGQIYNKLVADKEAQLGRKLNEDELNEIDSIAGAAGNVSFGINLALVGGSNFVQFGKLFNKGFSAEKKVINNLYKDSDGIFKSSSSKLGKISNILESNFTEATQEQLQYATQKGIEDFVSKLEDKDSNDTVSNIIDSTVKGLQEAYGSKEGIEQGLIGSIIATLTGGNIRSYKENKEIEKNTQEALDRLNEFKLKDKIKPLYDNAVRQIAYQKDKDQALKQGDQFAYQNAEDGAFKSYVKTRIDTGEFESFLNELDSIKDLPEDQYRNVFGLDPNEPLSKDIPSFIEGLKSKAKEINKINDVIDTNFSNLEPNIKDYLFDTMTSISDINRREDKLSKKIAELTQGKVNYKSIDNLNQDSIESEKLKVRSLIQELQTINSLDENKSNLKENTKQIKELQGKLKELDKTDLNKFKLNELNNQYTNWLKEANNPQDSIEVLNSLKDLPKLSNAKKTFKDVYNSFFTEEGQNKIKSQIEEKQKAKLEEERKADKEKEKFENKKNDLLGKATSGFIKDSKGNKIPKDQVEITPENIKEFKPITSEEHKLENESNSIDSNIEKENNSEKLEKLHKEKINKHTSKEKHSNQDDEIIPLSEEEIRNIEAKTSELPTPFKTSSIDKRNPENGKIENEKDKALVHYHKFTESLNTKDIKDGKLKFKVVLNPEKTPLYNSKFPDAIILQVIYKSKKPVLFEDKPVYTYLPLVDTLQKQWNEYLKNNPSKLKEFNNKLDRFKKFRESIENNISKGIDSYFNINGFNSGRFVIKSDKNTFSVINPEIANSKDISSEYKSIKVEIIKEDKEVIDNTGASQKFKKGTIISEFKGKNIIFNNRKLNEDEVNTSFKLIKDFQSGKRTENINGKTINIKDSLENLIFFGANKSNSKYMIYLDNKNNLYYKGKKLNTDEEIKSALQDKYLNINDKPLLEGKPFIEVYNEGREIREWPSYKEYLLSDRFPNGTFRDISSVPLTSNVETYGKPQIIGRYLTYEDKFYSPIQKNSPIEGKEQVSEESTEITPLRSFDELKDKDILILEGTKATLAFTSIGEFLYRKDKEDSSKDIIGEEALSKSNNSTLKDIQENVKAAIERNSITDLKNNIPLSYLIKKEIKKETSKEENKEENKEIPNNFSILEEEPKTKEDKLSKINKKIRNTSNKTGVSFDRSSLLSTLNYKKENIEEAKKWIKDIFGNDEDFEIVNGLIENKSFGQFTEAGKILISNIAEEGTVYHEAFHKVFNLYFTPEQRNRLISDLRSREDYEDRFKEISKSYPNNSKDIIDQEILAEDFRSYILTGKLPNENLSIFKKLLRFIKNLITGTKSTEEIFDRINKGFYKNAPRFNYNVNTKLNRAFNINGVKYSEAFTRDVLDSITYFMFNNLFEGNLTYQNLFNKKNTVKVAYQRSKIDFENRINELVRIANEPDTTEEEIDLISELIDQHEFIVDNWNSILPYHADYFKQFGITLKQDSTEAKDINQDDYDSKVEETDEDERVKDTVFDKASYEYSSIDTMPKNIKLLISTLIEEDNNSLGIPKLVNFNKTYGYLANELSELPFSEMVKKLKFLAGIIENPSIEEQTKNLERGFESYMLPKIKHKALSEEEQRKYYEEKFTNGDRYKWLNKVGRKEDAQKEKEEFVNSSIETPLDLEKEKEKYIKENLKPEIEEVAPVKSFIPDLISKLKIDRKDLTEDDLKLQIQFANEMSKTKLKFYLGYFNKDGAIVFGDANQNRAEDRVKANWRSLIRDSKYVKNVNGKMVLSSIPEHKNYIEFLQQLGINPSFKDKLNTEDKSKFENSMLYIIKALKNQINSGELEDIFSLKDVGKRLNDLLSLEVKYNEDITENQHINSEGKTVYDITLPSFLTRTVAKIKQGKWKEIEHLDTIYNKRSLWAEEIKRGYTRIEVALLDGITDTINAEGTHTSKLSTSDKISQEFNALLGQQKMTSMLRMADKKSEYSIKGFGLTIPIEDFKNGDAQEHIKNIFYGYFLDELERIQDYHFNNGYKNIETYNKNGGKWTIFDNILKQETKDKLKEIQTLRGTQVEYELENQIKEDILEFLRNQTEEEYKYFGDNGLLTLSGDYFIGIDKSLQNTYASGRSMKEIKTLIEAYTVNKIINHIEQIKLFYGDLAFFKYEKGDFFKRTPYISAAKKSSINEDTFNNEFLNRTKDFGIGDRLDKKHQENPELVGKIKTITFDDVELPSTSYNTYLKELKQYFLLEGSSEEEALSKATKLCAAYKGVNEADAQGYITLDEYREFLNRTGDWLDKHEDLYRKIRKGESLNSEDIFYFMPLKAQYSAIHKDGNLAKPVFHKYSLMPLIPSLIEGTNLEKLSEYMTNNKVGYALYKSGSKIAPKLNDNGKYNKLYDEEGNFLPSTDLVNEIIDYNNLGIQVEIAPKVKNKLIDGIQQRKLKWSDVFNEGKTKDENLEKLFKDYCNSYDKLFENEKDQLINELGLQESKDENGNVKYEQIDISKLIETLRDEGISRNSPDNLLDGLQVINKGDKTVLKYPFDALPNRNKIESIVMSIITSRIIRLKQNGEAYIQGSIAGFEPLGKRNFKQSNRLKFYRKSEDGKTLPAQIAIPLPEELLPLLNRYSNNISEDEKIKLLNKDLEEGKIDKSLISLIGYRIPCQGMNSIESFEVGFFLPRTVGTLCLVPTEMTAKAGSDFDIDKLNIFRPNVKLDENKQLQLESEGKKGIQNEIIRITKEIVEHPSNFIKLITPNNTNTLMKSVEELREINPKENKSPTDIIIPRKVIETGKQFLDGKDGVGISAVHNTHHVLSQIANLKLDDEISLKNNGNLSSVKDIEGNNIADILSEVINAFVDVAKDPFIRDLNLNTQTANIYLILVRLGVPFDKIALFMNQPIIREYIKAKEFNGSTIVDKTGFYNKNYNKKGLKIGKEKIIDSIKRNYPTKGVLSNGHYISLINNKQVLTNLISRKDINPDDYNLIQKRVLDDFIKYEGLANKMRDIMSASNQDAKTPKDVVSLNDMLLKYEEVSKMKGVENFDKLFKLSGETNLLGVFKKAQDTCKLATTPLFITQSPVINQIVHGIIAKLNINSTSDRQRLLKIIENDFLNFVIQNKAEFNNKNFKDYVNSLFYGDNSLPKRILRIKEGKYSKLSPEVQEKISNNIFVKELYPIVASKEGEQDILRLFNRRMTTYDSNILTNSFIELYELHPGLADGIAVMGILQSGVSTSAISYTDKIPFEIYGKFISPIVEKMQLNNGLIDGLDYSYFEYLFYANNMNSKYVRKLAKDINANELKSSPVKIAELGNWKFKNFNTENAIVLPNITNEKNEETKQDLEDDHLQISSNRGKDIEELNNKMLAFFNSIGVDYKTVDQITDRRGNSINAIAKADMLNRIVEVVEDKAKEDTLPEEAAHFFVELLPNNHPLLNRMMDQIIEYPEYQETLENYNDIYGGNEYKIRKEAIGKVIAKEIINQFNNSEKKKRQQVRYWWSTLWDFVKNLFSKASKEDINSFSEAASRILNKEVENKDIEKDGEFYQLESEANEFTPIINKIRETLRRQIAVYEKKVESESENKALDKLKELEEDINSLNNLEAINAFIDKAHSSIEALNKKIIDIKSYVDNKDFKNKFERDQAIRDLNEINEYNQSLSVLSDINKFLILNGHKDNINKLSESISTNKLINDIYFDLSIPLMADFLFDQYNKGINEQLEKSGNKDKILTREKLEEELRQPTKDISKLESWLVATSNVDDAILGLFSKALKKQLYKANKENIKNQDEALDAFNKWIKDNKLNRDNNEKLFDKFIEREEFHGKPRLKFIEKNSEKFKDLSEKDKEFYGVITFIHLSSQEGIPEANKLGYFLPALEKTSKEHLIENKKLKLVDKDKQEEIRSSLQTLEGKNYKKVPIYFSHYIDPKDQSRNIVESVLSYTSEINKYKAYNQIQGHVNAIQSIVNSRNPFETTSKGENIIDSLADSIGIKSKIKKETNNRADKLNSFIDMVYYGINTKPEKVSILGKEINYGRIGDKLTGFTAINALAGDWLQGFNNATVGNLTSFAEAVGGRNYSKKDWWAANKEYFMNSGKLLNDVGNGNKSLLSQLVREYDAIQGQFKDNTGKDITSSKYNNLLETDSIFFLQNITEHQIQVTTFIAFLKATKIKNKLEEEVSLYDAYELDSNNKLKLKDGFEYLEDNKFELMNKIHAANKKNNGVYNGFDRLPMQQYTLGRMALVFRKFIVPTVRARFGGSSIDYESGLVNQGYYISFAKKLIQAYKERSLKVLFDWKNMSDYEKEGIKRSMVDLITLGTTFTLILALTKGDDDEEPTALDNFMLYQAMRLNGDMAFYIPGIGFNDQFRVLRTPTAVASTVDKATKLLGQIFKYDFKDNELGLFEQYSRDSGLNKKGDYKVLSRLERLFPVYNNIIESMSPDYSISVLQKVKN